MPSGDDVAEPADPALCIALANMDAAGKALAESGPSDSALVMTSRYEAFRATLLEVRASASGEITPDIDLMVEAVDLTFAALEAADFDLSQAEVPSSAEMSESLQSAAQRVREYTENECGLITHRARRASAPRSSVTV